MATEEQKPVEIPKEEVAAPTVEPVIAEVAPVTAETAAVEAPAVETPAVAATETPAAEVPAAAEAPKEEDKKEEPKEEIKPIEEGVLEHRKGAGFPKNLMSTKHTFWFGVAAIEKDALAAYLKAEKSAEIAFHNAAWATKTGAGLLFYGDKKDSIIGIINLADSDEPEADGNSKLHLTTKGVKHTFKAPTKAERDSWVAQLKTKITEAKEAAPSVTESEEYKTALETLKVTKPAKKEEKKEDKPVEEGAVKEEDKPVAEAPKVEEGAAETPKAEEPVVAESSKAALEEPKDPKRRSTSRKRFSVFGLNKSKKEEKKEETASPTEATAPVAEETAAPVETPAAEVPAAETPAAEIAPVAAETPAATEDKPAEEKKSEEKKEEEATTPVKPTATKRNSFFDLLRPKKAPAATPPTEAAPVTEEPVEGASTEAAAPVAETAPVIPPVDTGAAPVAEPVASPVTETPAAEETPTAPTEKQEIKAEKRKSSLPFLGGKKDKSPTEETNEKADKVPLFSRLRQTIKVS
jgi:hypothetical protein